MQKDELEEIPFMDSLTSRRPPSTEYPPSSHHDEPLTPTPRTPDAKSAAGGNRPDVWKFGDLGDYWIHVDKMTDQYHDELVKGLKSNLDNLLIFAALFSAVNSTFMGFSLPALSAGPADQTNKLLKLMLLGYNNATWSQDDLDEDPFFPTTDSQRINQLFSLSLTFSLLASFGALLGQQWVIHYNKRSPAGSEKERWERQRKLEAAQRWYFEPIVEIVLPGLLQFALFIFLIGFLDFLYGLTPSVALPNAILTGLAALAFFLTVLASIRDPYCPYRTSAPRVFGSLIRGFLNWLFERFPSALSGFRKRLESHVARGLDKDYFSPWRRPAEKIPLLTVRSACKLLETSEDYQALLDTARNIPLLSNKAELALVYNSRVAMHRLREYASKETGKITTFSEAVCHLELMVRPPEARTPTHAERTEQVVVFERAADGHMRDVEDPVSFLPTSVATVAFVTTQSVALGARMWSLRPHQEYLLASLRRGPSPLTTVGLVAWMLLSNKDFIASPSDRRKILSDMGIKHELRPNHVRQELDDIGIALGVFGSLGPLPTRDDESRFLRFVLKAVQNCRGQARSTHKFLIVLTKGLEYILLNEQQSWQLGWEDVLLLIASLRPLLDNVGSEARPLPKPFDDAHEDETDEDWNKASEDAVNLVGEACVVMQRWKTPVKFADAAAGLDELLIPFTDYIKRLSKRYKIPGTPAAPLAFEEFALHTVKVPKDRIRCSEGVFPEFEKAWQAYRALPRSEQTPTEIQVDSSHSQVASTLVGQHGVYLSDGGETAVSDPGDAVSLLRRPTFAQRPASLMSIPSFSMSPTQRYSRTADFPEEP